MSTEAIRSEWDARLYDYQIARLMVDADEAWGPLNQVSEAHEQERRRVTEKYGSWELAKASGAKVDDTLAGCQAVEQESLELYSRPMWEAARALVSLPSPDLAAFKIKLEVIDREEVWNDGNFDGDCWEIVKADAARLRVAA